MRLAVIGLDGLSYTYLDKIMKAVNVPNIKYIMDSGFSTVLYAYPPMTPPSWTSIMTGVDPASHGIYDFSSMEGSRMLISIGNLEHPRIHEILDMFGRKSIMINPIPSYPLIPLKNSIQISNAFFTPRKVFHPPDIEKYAGKLSLHSSAKSFEETLVNGVKYLDEYIELVEELIDYFDFDLFWITLPYPDHYLHRAGDPTILHGTLHSGEKSIFSRIDKIVGTLMRNTDAVVIVSDHGFSSYKYLIFINTYLYYKGLVKPLEAGKVGKTKNGSHEWKHKLLIWAGRHKVFRRAGRILFRALGRRRVKPKFVDRSRSKAYLTSHTSFGVRVAPSVEPGEVRRVLEEVPGIESVVPKEELFKGPFIDRLPDLYLVPDFDGGYFIGNEKIWTRVVAEARGMYVLNHHPKGVFMVSGYDLVKTIPSTIPNYTAGNLLLALLDLPLSIYARGVEEIREIIGEEPRRTNIYVKRWGLIKRLHRRLRRPMPGKA